MMKYGFIIGVVLLVMSGAEAVHGQSVNKFIRKGNRLYQQQDFTDAEAEYKKALNKDSKSPAGLFNLGNSLYEQKRFQEAMDQYANSAKNSLNPLHQSASDYNIGNTFMSDKKWEDAIQAYKKSLLRNPSDNEARYNLAYAQEMLKKQQSGGGGKNNKEQNKQNRQNKQDQPQNKGQNQQNKDRQQQQPRPEPGDISKQRADQLLNAAEQAEQKLQEKKDQKQQGQPVYGGKNW